jgi:conjugal transfer pilus assembly protein TraF
MRLPILALTFCAIYGIAASAGVHAQATINTDKPKVQEGKYGRGQEGWFFYKDPPAVEKPKAPKPKAAQPKNSTSQPKVLSAEWLRENLPKYRNIAIDNPTKDNVELYLLMQKLAMDKAEQFALASRHYAQQNPALDETVQNPTSTLSRRAMVDEQEARMDSVIRQLSKRVGIYYFFRSDCTYCHKQNPMLEIMTRVTGMSVLPISLDGLPSQDGLLPNWRPDQGQGAYLGVEKTPTMYLVEPGGKVLLLSVGVRAMPDLKERIVQLAADNQWISKEQYDLAMRGMPRKFITDGLDPELVKDDPKKLLSVLRDASTYGRTEGTVADMDNAEASPWAGKRKSK